MRRATRKRRRAPTCRQPDRDSPKLLCGYPLPCPHHTAILHTDKRPPTIEIPVTATAAIAGRDRLADVLDTLTSEEAS
jgi:hypothetical protein